MSGTHRIQSIRRIDGKIEVVTGLRIGGSQDAMEISGLDNPIIRNPANSEPFIPGSSIRGRLRSLAEWYFNELPKDGNVIHPILNSNTARVFGVPARDPSKASDADRKALTRGPTRLIIRDARLCEADRNAFASGRPITEVKSENSINRITAMANPRPMERVLPGVRFELEMVYRVFDLGDGGKEDEALFTKVVLTSLALLELDALGGGGSRGNGKVRLVDLKADGKPLTLPTITFPAPATA